MLINRAEMIDEIERHIRKHGGKFDEWCVGTARDARAQFFSRHLAEDLADGLSYREAFTTDVAQDVVAHLVNDRGLEFDRDAVPDPGRIVFVYRKARDTGYGARDTQRSCQSSVFSRQ